MSEVIVVTSGKGGVGKPRLPPILESDLPNWGKKSLW